MPATALKGLRASESHRRLVRSSAVAGYTIVFEP